MARKVVRQDPGILALFPEKLNRTHPKPAMDSEGWLRASSIARMCPREEVLARREQHNQTRVSFEAPHDTLTFAMGTGAHYVAQNEVLPAVECLRGLWKCTNCGQRHPDVSIEVSTDETTPMKLVDASIARPAACSVCCSIEDPDNPHVFRYQEWWLRDWTYRVQGHTDGLIVVPELPDLGVFELKTAGTTVWDATKNVPAFEHVLQLQTCLWLTGLQWGLILYWAKHLWKDTTGGPPVREYFVERDEDTIDLMKRAVVDLRDGLVSGELPERICSEPDCARADGCPMAALCFAEGG